MAAWGELNEATIRAAALDLVDAKGYAALSMRNVATRLDVKAASLYYHVPNRVALLRLIADSIAAEVVSTLGPGRPWRTMLAELAQRLRTTLAAHPGATVIVATQDVSSEVWQPLVPQILASFQGGLAVDDETALLLSQSLYVMVTGLALAEFGDAPNPPAAPTEFYDRWFDVAVTTFLDGIAARYPANEGS